MHIGISNLYHANSVTTSYSFLREGGLCSRNYFESRRIPQTPQKSDARDKYNKVWDFIFLNLIDIHSQCGNVCYYGPVSFKLKVDILNSCSKIFITKSNPQKWCGTWDVYDIENFTSLSKTCFDNMLMVVAPDGKLEFNENLIELCVDDPKRGNLYYNAIHKLSSVRPVKINMRSCTASCRCKIFYKSDKNNDYLRKMFM